jgi:hypothetical protein
MNGKKECEKLLNALLPLAERMLKEYGEFYPYGGYMKPSGEIVQVGAEDEDTDYPKSKDLLYLVRDSLADMVRAGKCKATAIVFNVRVDLPKADQKGDAIQISVEHLDCYCAEIFSPYEIVGSRLNFGTTFAQESKHEVFIQR